MDVTSLMAISPLDGRYQPKTRELASIFSEYGLMKYRIIVEVRWLQTLLNTAALPELSAFGQHHSSLLNTFIDHFSPEDAARIKQIESRINHDVKAVEYFIKERIASHSELIPLSEFIHFGCTSEDINNVAYALMLKDARKQCVLPALDNLITSLRQLAHEYASYPMLSRTHGQPATPTSVGKEIANFVARLQRQQQQLSHTPILGKFNGATGNYSALVSTYPTLNWQTISQDFISTLGLTWNAYTTQIEPHDYLAELFHILIQMNTILIGLSRDIWGYIALNYFTQKTVTHEVGSSTMPHKVNPIDFENAEGNLGLANAVLEHMALKLPISRWQRDLSDSTVLRNMGVGIAYAMLGYDAICNGLRKITANRPLIEADLDRHWEVLAEPIQTMMRRFGIEQPYEKLKNFTRGKPVTKELLHAFIAELSLADPIKQELYQLTPANYLGYAASLAAQI